MTTKLFYAVFLWGLFLPVFVFAQTPAPASQDSLQGIVRQLQEQVTALQKQITDLQSQLKSSQKEATQTKEELQVTKEEVKIIKEELKLTRSLKRGESGEEVKKLQEYLKQFPDIYPEGLITGFFG